VALTAVGTPREALAALEQSTFACVLLDARLPRGGAFSLVDRLREASQHADLPVVVYAEGELSARDEERRAGLDGESVRAAARPRSCSTSRRPSSSASGTGSASGGAGIRASRSRRSSRASAR